MGLRVARMGKNANAGRQRKEREDGGAKIAGGFVLEGLGFSGSGFGFRRGGVLPRRL